MSKLIVVAVFSLVVGGLAAFLLHPETRTWMTQGGNVTTTGKALIGGPFTLVDHTGKSVTEKDYEGRYKLVFFGFRNCPDICPSALQSMAAALEAIGAKALRVVPLFITLDPERDTPERLAEYVASFHPKLVGLSGTLEQVQAAAKAYRVYFKKNETGQGPGNYTLDHTSIIYLMDPKGEFVLPFAHGTTADRMAERLRAVL